MTLKPGQSAQELGDFMNVVLEKSGTSLKVRYGTSWGKTVEKDDLFFLVMGWNSLQVSTHFDYRLYLHSKVGR